MKNQMAVYYCDIYIIIGRWNELYPTHLGWRQTTTANRYVRNKGQKNWQQHAIFYRCPIMEYRVLFILFFILSSAIAPFVITHSRAQAISYSHIIDSMHDELAIKNPTDTFNFEAYTKPLRLWSWIFIGIFCIVCPPFLYLTTRWVERNHGKFSRVLEVTFLLSLWF